MKKMTVEIEDNDYLTVADNLHHGQLTHITRVFIKTIAKKFKTDAKEEVISWLYGNKPLTLPPTKDTT